MLNIIVCVKQVLDPEAPTSVYRIEADGKHISLKGVPPVINPFDENALQAAILIKAAQPAKITVLSLGHSLSRGLLRKTLAYGADELILVEDEKLVDLDSSTTAFVLGNAIKKIGTYNLVLTGREAADTNAGVVGSGIANILGINVINIARKVEVKSENKLAVQRIIPDGYEELETGLPALVTISNEAGTPRAATVQEMMAAQKKPITTWKLADIGVDLPAGGKSKLVSLNLPKRETKCEFAEGDTPEAKGANLAKKLKDAGVI
jgi:electron transfer flavoprotein beta subunit